MTGEISARDWTIGDLVRGTPRLEVPGYQRPYAWSVESVERLLDDLLDVLRNAAEGVDGTGSYFLGSIVLSRRQEGGALDVVDGQQRLITLTILLAVLRDLGLDDAGLNAAVDSAVIGPDGRPRIVPRSADADAFYRTVQLPGAALRMPDWAASESRYAPVDATEPETAEDADDEDEYLDHPPAEMTAAEEEPGEPRAVAEARGEGGSPEPEERDDTDAPAASARASASDSQRAMLDAREVLRARIAGMPGQGAFGRDALARLVLEQCVVVVIEVGDGASAHDVFRVLNTRGERLSETDILKAEVLGAIGEARTRRACQAIWEDCEAELGRAELENLFSHIRMIGVRRRQRRTIVEEIRQHYAPVREPEAFVDNVMQPLAAILAQVIACDLRVPGADETTHQLIQRYLTYLSWLPNTSWRPAALAFIHRHGDDAPAILRFLKALDRLAYGLLILKRDEGERTSKYRLVLEAIEGERNLFSARASALRLDRRARDMILSRLSGSYFGSQSFAGVVLRRIDAEHVRGPLPDYDGTTIEHVLPRNPERRSQWLRWFPGDESDPMKGVTENFQRLGNLILLPAAQNSAAGNSSLPDKWAIYFDADAGPRLALKEQLRDLRSWTPRALAAIHGRRIARMTHVWGLGTGGQQPVAPGDPVAEGAHPA